jgi:hypothetical protein
MPSAGPHDTKQTVLAWLYTGPLGHLAAGVADWAELLARYARERGRSFRTRA